MRTLSRLCQTQTGNPDRIRNKNVIKKNITKLVVKFNIENPPLALRV